MRPGDRIRFLRDVYDAPDGDRPGFEFARGGDLGTVVSADGSGCVVQRDGHEAWFRVQEGEIDPI